MIGQARPSGRVHEQGTHHHIPRNPYRVIYARRHPYGTASGHYPASSVADDGHHPAQCVDKLSARVTMRGNMLAMRMVARQRRDGPS
jgi:hypothetical protein